MSEINAYNKESIIHEAKQSQGALSPPEIPYFTRGLKPTQVSFILWTSQDPQKPNLSLFSRQHNK